MNQGAPVSELRQAIKDCTDRGLLAAAKWAGELLVAIPPEERRRASTFAHSTPARPTHSLPRTSLSFSEADTSLTDAEADEEEADLLEVAKAYYAMKELDRAAHLLKDCKGPKARFLAIYCRFLASDKQAQDAWETKTGTREQELAAVNPELVNLLALVQNDTEPFLLFLKGVLLARMNRRPEATEALIRSVKAYPWNWSCWKQLGRVIQDNDEFAGIRPHIGDHPAATLFSVTIMIDLHAHAEGALDLLHNVHKLFPQSLYIQALRAQIFYHLRDFDEAEQIFERVLADDPYRVDEIDVYSNILYVMKKKARLSDIAHQFVKVAKDRPEVCCLVGNYYSLRTQHEQAIRYFQRAVLLDRSYLAAWTLMGHEWVELKNSQAAIEAYRRAIDVNRKDYRAWYGLGQTYEMIDMPHYALHYFQRATALRPYDIRMWQALASCYQNLNKYKDAVQCYRRALFGVDQHSQEAASLIHKLATLYTLLNKHEQAAACHTRVVELAIHSHPDVPITQYAKSVMFVAQWEISQGAAGDMTKARALLKKVAESAAEESGDAAAKLRALDAAEGLATGQS
ncbi:anaphase-promoting complex subunit 8 [Ceratobasidium sp. AG-Ba]|nr:anaphase-promoting complex subunit 8 [Ceratobasidium sp. AG-Ba]